VPTSVSSWAATALMGEKAKRKLKKRAESRMVKRLGINLSS
jgi:hypothetical protein